MKHKYFLNILIEKEKKERLLSFVSVHLGRNAFITSVLRNLFSMSNLFIEIYLNKKTKSIFVRFRGPSYEVRRTGIGEILPIRRRRLRSDHNQKKRSSI